MSAAATAPASQPSRASGLLGLGNHPAVHGRQFGTTNITLILARIARGLLRAAALEARLHRSAARLDAPPRPRPPRASSAAAEPRAPCRRASPRDTDDDAALLAHMPTPEEIAAEVRRRPIGEVIADIVRDLGILPAHPLWRELSRTIMIESGRHAALVNDIIKRPRRVPIPEHWPDEPPPYLWAAWSYSPTPAATGPP